MATPCLDGVPGYLRASFRIKNLIEGLRHILEESSNRPSVRISADITHLHLIDTGKSIRQGLYLHLCHRGQREHSTNVLRCQRSSSSYRLTYSVDHAASKNSFPGLSCSTSIHKKDFKMCRIPVHESIPHCSMHKRNWRFHHWSSDLEETTKLPTVSSQSRDEGDKCFVDVKVFRQSL